jgi:hypothetical protein
MSMDKPNQPYPSTPATSITSTQSQMPLFLPDPSIKSASFDQLLSQRGVRMVHHKAMPCMNVKSTDFQAHDPECQYCDNSGIIYYESREIWGVFTGNSMEKTFEAHGVWETGSAVVTLPTMYPDGTQADFNTYDRLELVDFSVRLWELKGYEPRPDNLQELRYPVQKVEYASSIVDNVQKFYVQGVDFNITTDNVESGGLIQWVDGKEPAYDVDLQRGEVIGWAYYAKPVYVVLQTLRELRITQEMVHGTKQAIRLPQQVLVRRDFLVGIGEKIVNPVVP